MGFEERAGLIAGVGVAPARARLIQSQRRDAHRLPGLEPLFGLRALAVHAQFALSNDALDMGEGEPRKPRLDEAIDAHAGFVRCYLGGLYAGRGRRALADGRAAAPLRGNRAHHDNARFVKKIGNRIVDRLNFRRRSNCALLACTICGIISPVAASPSIPAAS